MARTVVIGHIEGAVDPEYYRGGAALFAAAGIPQTCVGAGGVADGVLFYYDGDEMTPEQVTALEAASANAAALSPPIPTRIDNATVIPSPGLVLDLGAGAQRYGTLYCETVNQLSDVNLKEDVETLQLGRSFVDQLRPVSFRYRGKKRTHLGFIAQEVRDALGDDAAAFALWCETPVDGAARTGLPPGLDSVQSLRPDQLIAVLTRCCQEQDDLICDLQSKLGDAEEKIEALLEQSGRHTSDISYCYETIAAIQKAIRERPPPS